MKILMLSWEYPPRIVGGISRVVYDLAQKLGEKGNEVHVVTCMDKNTKEFEKDLNVYVHRVYTVYIRYTHFKRKEAVCQDTLHSINLILNRASNALEKLFVRLVHLLKKAGQ